MPDARSAAAMDPSRQSPSPAGWAPGGNLQEMDVQARSGSCPLSAAASPTAAGPVARRRSRRRRSEYFKLPPSPAGASLSQDVPPLRWDVPPDIEKAGRPSHPSSKVWGGGWGLCWASLLLTYGSLNCFMYLYE